MRYIRKDSHHIFAFIVSALSAASEYLEKVADPEKKKIQKDLARAMVRVNCIDQDLHEFFEKLMETESLLGKAMKAPYKYNIQKALENHRASYAQLFFPDFNTDEDYDDLLDRLPKNSPSSSISSGSPSSISGSISPATSPSSSAGTTTFSMKRKNMNDDDALQLKKSKKEAAASVPPKSKVQDENVFYNGMGPTSSKESTPSQNMDKAMSRVEFVSKGLPMSEVQISMSEKASSPTLFSNKENVPSEGPKTTAKKPTGWPKKPLGSIMHTIAGASPTPENVPYSSSAFLSSKENIPIEHSKMVAKKPSGRPKKLTKVNTESCTVTLSKPEKPLSRSRILSSVKENIPAASMERDAKKPAIQSKKHAILRTQAHAVEPPKMRSIVPDKERLSQNVIPS